MRSRLDEFKFSDLTPLGEALRRHYGKGRYIHFSRQNKRLGVNTKAHHMDPKGVYFYPVDWLWDSNKFQKGDQWATNWPYWFIVEVDFSRPGLNLDTLTLPQVEMLAHTNGWSDVDLEVSRHAPWAVEQQSSVAKDTWMYLKAINQLGWTWAKTLRGLGWVKDSNGVIMSYEPEQVCVMDPRAMKLIESGQQDELHAGNENKWEYFRRPVTMVMNQMADKHGGKVVWKNKMPTLVIAGDDWRYTVEFDQSWRGAALIVNIRLGRAEDRHTVDRLHHYEIDTLQEKLETFLEACQNYSGNDLQFTPHMDEQAVEAWIKSKLTQRPNIDWKISNSTHVMWATHNDSAGSPPVNLEFMVGTDDDDAWAKVNLRINDNLFIAMSGFPLDEFEDKFWENIERFSHDKKQDFEDEGLWEKFLGWVGHYSGLAILEPYEEKFLNSYDKGELYGQIQRSFRRVGW